MRVVARHVSTKLSKFRKRKYRSIVIRSKAYFNKIDGTHYTFIDNGAVILKRRMNTLGRELYGPTSKDLKIKKFRVAFRYVY